ncbi:MAG: hypothetical protein AB8B87_24795 [Granulosicoccus sp.]
MNTTTDIGRELSERLNPRMEAALEARQDMSNWFPGLRKALWILPTVASTPARVCHFANDTLQRLPPWQLWGADVATTGD